MGRSKKDAWMMADRVLLEHEKGLAPLWKGLCTDVLKLLEAAGGMSPTLAKVTAVQVAKCFWEMLRETCDAEAFEEQIQAYINDEDMHPIARERLMARATERGVVNSFHMEQADALIGLYERLMELQRPQRGAGDGETPRLGRLLPLEGGKR